MSSFLSMVVNKRGSDGIYSGIYVPNTDEFPIHFRGIGIRIEDSVCVQEEHPLVLTTEAVKEVSYPSFYQRMQLECSAVALESPC